MEIHICAARVRRTETSSFEPALAFLKEPGLYFVQQFILEDGTTAEVVWDYTLDFHIFAATVNFD